MRAIVLFLPFHFLWLTIHAQLYPGPTLPSSWYFSDLDSVFFSPDRMKAGKVKLAKEYRTDKKYSDTLQLMCILSFDTTGILTAVTSYDIYGTADRTEYKSNADGKLTEVWVTHKGVLEKSHENIFKEKRLVKKISYYDIDYITTTNYIYNEEGLLQSELSRGPKLSGKFSTRVYSYDSLKRVVSEAWNNPDDTVPHTYVYKYDSQGRKNYEEHREGTATWITKYDYSAPTPSTTVMKIFSGNTLVEIRTKKFNELGLVTELISDHRMGTFHRYKRSWHALRASFGPSYEKTTFEYDARGNCISQKEYSSPRKIYQCTNYTFNSQGNLIHKVIFRGSKKDSEWTYSYIQ